MKSFTSRQSTRILIILTLLVSAVLLFAKWQSSEAANGPSAGAGVVSTRAVPLRSEVTAQAERRGNPWVNYQNGREATAVYKGSGRAVMAAAAAGGSRPVALASADFDGDANADLVAGYSAFGGGALAIHRANPDAFSTLDPETAAAITETRYPSPFRPDTVTIQLQESPDYLTVGDFNNDGYQDIVLAAKGGHRVSFLLGDGTGNFRQRDPLGVPGTITSMFAMNIDWWKGTADLMVGVEGATGPELLVYSDEIATWEAEPAVISLPAIATSITAGVVDDRPMPDIVVAAGRNVVIAHPDSSPARSHRVERVELAANVQDVQVGQFIWDREGRRSIAALTDDGGISVLTNGSVDRRPFTENESNELKRRRLSKVGDEGRTAAKSLLKTMVRRSRAGGWIESERFEAGTGATKIIASSLSSGLTDDLMVLRPTDNQLKVIVAQQDKGVDSNGKAVFNAESFGQRPSALSIDVSSTPLVALPMKVNLGTRNGFVVFQQGRTEPTIIPAAALAVFNVTTTTDTTTCGAPCSLRGATIQSNATVGPNQINVPAGTYTLTLSAGPIQGDAKTFDNEFFFCGGFIQGGGDLDLGVNDVSVVGTGGPIVQPGTTAATTPTNGNGIDRVFGINDCGSPGNAISVTISGMTIRNGKSPENDPDNNPGTVNSFFHDGGGVLFFAVNWPTNGDTNKLLTLSGVTVSNNFAAGQGGGVRNVNGALTVNNTSVISSNLSYHTKGGGICYDGEAAAAPARTLQVANTTITGNSSLFNPVANFASNAGEGGGIQAAGGTGVTLTTVTINATNHAALRGGGIAIANAPLVVITGGSISNNTSRGDGGGLWSSSRVASTNAESTVTINGTTISGNVADSDNATPADTPTGDGGGILNFVGNMTIGNTTAVNILSNSAINGGGVYSTWSGNAGDDMAGFSMTNGLLGQTAAGNTAKNNGGGIAFTEALAGAPSTFGPTTFVSTTIQANTANSDSAGGGDGGGIYIDTGSINPLNGVTIDNNVANSGGLGDGIRLAGGSITGSNTINVNNGDSLYLSAGTFTSTAGTLNLTGNLTRDAANTFTHNSGTVVFNGTAAQTLNGTATSITFNNVTVQKTGTLGTGGSLATIVTNNLTLTTGAFTAPATLDINGQLSIASGTTLTAGANITAFLNWTNNGGTFTPGSGTVTFDGTGAQSIQGTAASQTFNNLTIAKTAGTLLNTAGSTTSLTVNNLTETTGNFTAPATLDINGNMILTAGTFTAGANITAGGNWTQNGGTFTPGSGTVTFDTAAANTLGGSVATQTFNNIDVAKGAGSLTGAASITTLNLNGSMTLTSGTFAVGTITLINLSGNWTNNGGTFTPGSSTVSFNNAAAGQTIGGSAATQTFNTIIINKGAQTLGTGGSLTTLDLNSSMQLTTGTFVPPASLLIGVNFTQATGTTFTPGSGTVTFDGSGAQNIDGTLATKVFNNFVMNKGGGTLTAVASTTALDINGNVTLTAGTFAAGTATTINVAGNWTNNGGTFTPGTGTVVFDGGAGQAIGGTTATTFNNLTNGNAIGLAVNNNNNVNGILALTSSDITVASGMVITQPPTPASTGTFDVVGSVRRTNTPNPLPTTPLTFGNPNNIVTFTAAGTRPIDLLVNLVKTVPPGFAAAVARHYNITPNGGTGFNFTIRLHYLDSELNGNTEGAGLGLWVHNGVGYAPRGQTANDTTNNWVEDSNNTHFSPWGLNSTLAPTADDGNITGTLTTPEGNPIAGAVVRLNGAQNRKAITNANGTYRFSGIDTTGFYNVTPSRANFTFSPATRSFSQLGENTEASFSGSATGDSANPLDTAEFFVRQQYVDLLGREPDEGGFNYWSDRILECGADAACVNARRRDVAAAFFIEEEFQLSGAYIHGLYKGALGRNPLYAEFSTDRQQLVVGPNLEATKQALAESFVGRPEFVTRYQTNTTAESFVDAVLQGIRNDSGVDLSSQRDAAIAKYSGGSSLNQSRSLALRELTEGFAFRESEYNNAFVLTEYFGYLRRDADAGGYAFWLNVLNNREPGNFRGMVCAFITSAEYQLRFSAVISHTDRECAQ